MAINPTKPTLNFSRPYRRVWPAKLTNHGTSVLNVNDQLVAYATRFSAVRLKNYVWSHHRPLKAKGQYDFSRAYSPDHSNVPRLINIINIRYNITRHNIMQKVTPFFCNRCVFYSSSFKPNFPLDSPNSNVHFFSTFCDVNNSADTCKCRTEARAPFCLCQEHVFPILFKGATSRYFGQFRH